MVLQMRLELHLVLSGDTGDIHLWNSVNWAKVSGPRRILLNRYFLHIQVHFADDNHELRLPARCRMFRAEEHRPARTVRIKSLFDFVPYQEPHQASVAEIDNFSLVHKQRLKFSGWQFAVRPADKVRNQQTPSREISRSRLSLTSSANFRTRDPLQSGDDDIFHFLGEHASADEAELVSFTSAATDPLGLVPTMPQLAPGVKK